MDDDQLFTPAPNASLPASPHPGQDAMGVFDEPAQSTPAAPPPARSFSTGAAPAAPVAQPVTAQSAIKKYAGGGNLDRADTAVLAQTPMGPAIGGGPQEVSRTVNTTHSTSGKATKEAVVANQLAEQATADTATAVLEAGEQTKLATEEVTAEHTRIADQLTIAQAEMDALNAKNSERLEAQTTAIRDAQIAAQKAAEAIDPDRLKGGFGGALRFLSAMVGAVSAGHSRANGNSMARNGALDVFNKRLDDDYKYQMAQLGAVQKDVTFEQQLLAAIRANTTSERTAKGLYITGLQEIAAQRLLAITSKNEGASAQGAAVVTAKKLAAEAAEKKATFFGQERHSSSTVTSRQIQNVAAKQTSALEALQAQDKARLELNEGASGNMNSPQTEKNETMVRTVIEEEMRAIESAGALISFLEKNNPSSIIRFTATEDQQHYEQLLADLEETVARTRSGAAITKEDVEQVRKMATGEAVNTAQVIAALKRFRQHRLEQAKVRSRGAGTPEQVHAYRMRIAGNDERMARAIETGHFETAKDKARRAKVALNMP